jgi:dethiobiotin synthetase
MSKRLFITGTDTEVGKTRIAVGLLQALDKRGLRCLGLKPVAAGCYESEGRLLNDDALEIQSAANIALTYDQINPVRFAEPAAPNLLADRYGCSIDLSRLNQSLGDYLEFEPDYLIVEGFGGWLAPMNLIETNADIASLFDAEVILVVGLRLGCLNHTLLTVEAIRNRGLRLAGWVANAIDPDFQLAQENTDFLKKVIGAPLLGEVAFGSDASKVLGIGPILDFA